MEHKPFTDRVEEELQKKVISYIENLRRDLCTCESPIEQLLLLHLTEALDELDLSLSNYDSDRLVELRTQEQIGKYRLDFSARVKFLNKEYKFCIESDGHEFHEKTKEQAKRDKERDRFLMAKGYAVIRFTGSEVHENPLDCAYEVYEIIERFVGFEDYIDQKVKRDLGY